jgi:hypothetical protein
MIRRRGVLPALVLLALVAAGFVLALLRGPAGATPSPDDSPGAAAKAVPTAEAHAVLRSLAAVQRAYAAGNIRRLCRPGALVDPAVIRAQNAGRNECESELESLTAHTRRLQVTVRDIALRPDLATVVVSVAGGSEDPVDFVRRGGRWLLSFSAGNDPMPVLAGAL